MQTVEQLKQELKRALAQDLEKVFSLFEKVLAPKASVRNDLILQQGRFWEARRASNRGTATREETDLAMARIRAALLHLIDDLDVDDVSSTPGKTTLSSFTDQELEKLEEHGLRTQAQLLVRKINRLREALAVAVDPGVLLKYEVDLEKAEAELAKVREKLGE